MVSHDAQYTRPVWAEISARHLRDNYRRLRHAAGDGLDVLAVVKANAYGHGATECAPVLAAAGARWLGVTGVEEGVAVRRSLAILPQGMVPRILVMCGVWLGEAEACLQHRLTPVVWEPYQLELLQKEATRLGLPPQSVEVHLEVDTGMARQGVEPGRPMERLLESFRAAPALRLEGVLTHLASAECVNEPQNHQQATRFEQALQQLAQAGCTPEIVHVGNTSGIDSGLCAGWLPALAQAFGARPMTRAGLALYGHALPLQDVSRSSALPLQDVSESSVQEPSEKTPASTLQPLAPVLAWKTRVIGLRDIPAGATVGYNATYTATQPMRLALLPVGYADGFRRALSSTNSKPGGAVLVRGRRAPVIGRVSMDLSVIDASAVQGIAIGDEVTLLGSHASLSISAGEHAALAQTNVYEVLCGIHDRVPRVVVP